MTRNNDRSCQARLLLGEPAWQAKGKDGAGAVDLRVSQSAWEACAQLVLPPVCGEGNVCSHGLQVPTCLTSLSYPLRVLVFWLTRGTLMVVRRPTYTVCRKVPPSVCPFGSVASHLIHADVRAFR